MLHQIMRQVNKLVNVFQESSFVHLITYKTVYFITFQSDNVTVDSLIK